MRDLRKFDKYRDHTLEKMILGKSTTEEDRRKFGCFMIPAKGTRKGLKVIASTGDAEYSDGWDHLSVSLSMRCPGWDEMDRLKRMFFLPHEVCFQIHPAESNHISNHPFCLHIWHNAKQPVPLPPARMVGDSSEGSFTPGIMNMETVRRVQEKDSNLLSARLYRP